MRTTGTDININVNGITICYDDLGEGEIPVIFIHGFPFDKSSWQSQMEFLKTTHRVIAFDIRGFGKSTAGKETYSMSLFAADLVKFMDALDIDKAIVCGLSMGGYILLNALNRYPERFEAIVLCDTQCIADSTEAKDKRYQTIELIESGVLKEYAEGFIKNVFCKETLDNKKEVVEKIKNTILSTPPITIVKTLRALAQRWETCSTLDAVAIPTLILCGKEDTVTPLAQSEFMLKSISNAELRIIDSAGHLSNLEQPDEFNKQLLNFISGLMK